MRNHKPEKGPIIVQMLARICMLVFAIFWTVTAAAISAGNGFFAVFGLLFIVIAAVRIVLIYRHATGKDQKDPSSFHTAEQQPFERFDLGEQAKNRQNTDKPLSYCPSCGAKVEKEDRYCGDCGRKLN